MSRESNPEPVDELRRESNPGLWMNSAGNQTLALWLNSQPINPPIHTREGTLLSASVVWAMGKNSCRQILEFCDTQVVHVRMEFSHVVNLLTQACCYEDLFLWSSLHVGIEFVFCHESLYSSVLLLVTYFWSSLMQSGCCGDPFSDP